MSHFVKCSSENLQISYSEEYANTPVNIDLIVQIRKGTHHIYPDNRGKPCILFREAGIGENEIRWVYHPDDTKKRDEDYERIINEQL